jgi:hypothetical protein
VDLTCAGQLQHTFPPFPTLFFVFSRVARFRTRHCAVINTIPPRPRALCSNGGAYLPFCPRRRASHHVHFAQPVLFCTVRTHKRTYANPSPTTVTHALLSMTRPALTAGPPSQRPFLSGLANCYAPCRCLHREARTKVSNQTHSDQRALATKVKVKSLLRTSNRPSPPFCLARLRNEAEPGGSSFCHQTDTAT